MLAWEWPLKGGSWLDWAWILFSVANLVAMVALPEWETVPFHFIWVSLTLLYGFRVWRTGKTVLALGAVILTTGTVILLESLDGSQSWGEVTEVPLMSAMFLAMVWHARRRQSALDQLQRLNEANERLLEREWRFVQDASHELRTPITVALGHAELLHSTAANDVARRDARVVVEELMRLRRLADRLLLLAGSQHPDFLRTTRVDAQSLVLDAFRRWAPVPRRWVLGDLDEVTVEADPDRLSLALDALIENAVKHTREEQSIALSLRRRNGTALIAVADTGTGIPPTVVGHIFDRFTRADAARGPDGGAGLGLAIVKTVAEAHGGGVAVRSAPGEGSEFELRLPVAAGIPERNQAGAPPSPL
jgi:signal transduction histidine kinase